MPLENTTPGQRKVSGDCILISSLSKDLLETGSSDTPCSCLPVRSGAGTPPTHAVLLTHLFLSNWEKHKDSAVET